MIRIFLAHAKEDKAEVIKLYERLKQKGYKPWLDKKDLLGGQLWDDEIKKAINSSDIFIACLSKQSVEKQGYVQKEFRMALQKCGELPENKIYLIPLRLDDCKIPNLRQREYGINLRDYQWIDYFESDGFEQLIRAIEHYFSKSLSISKQGDSSDLGDPNSAEAYLDRVNLLAASHRAAEESFAQETMAAQATSRASKSPNPIAIDLGNGITLELVHIPGGMFLMGAPYTQEGGLDQERPTHQVTIPEFWMGKYPVTQEQYQAVIGNNPSRFFDEGASHPVENVSWYDAIAFCEEVLQKTGDRIRLPSEAEWEYACRAETTTRYYFGHHLAKEQANFSHNKGKTTPVGVYLPNAYGLYDMHSNVQEWCQDLWHDNYERAPKDGSAWMSGGDSNVRIARGGSFRSHHHHCLSASRDYTNLPSSNIGFRVAYSVPRISK